MMVAAIFEPKQAPSLWRMGLVMGLVGAFLSSVMASLPSGNTYQNAVCSSVFWNTSSDPNRTTYNFTCSYQPTGSSSQLATEFTCRGVNLDGVNCSCTMMTLNGKQCNSCSICNSRQATLQNFPELQVKGIAANCDGVLGSGDVCNTDCNKGWVGCGGAQSTTAPTSYVSAKPGSAPKASQAEVPRANFLVQTVTFVLCLLSTTLF